MVKAVKSLNPYEDGTCRTIKSQYYKNSLANFVRRGGYGATGVIKRYDKENNDCRRNG